ncbi:hypothetical protein M885DRAFT_524498 [Pelagophyceae sp. CCMP2097]|nr:hypothetical protein M885DRAFT_524498 [Pelagophyceae sp. CCMP2097]
MVLRSSLHTTRFSRSRPKAAGPLAARKLPLSLLNETKITYDETRIDLRGAIAQLLQRTPGLGHFADAETDAAAPNARDSAAPDASDARDAAPDARDAVPDAPDAASDAPDAAPSEALDMAAPDAREAVPSDEAAAGPAQRRQTGRLEGRLEDFRLADDAWSDNAKQIELTNNVLADAHFLRLYESLIHQVVLPWLKARLVRADPAEYAADKPHKFWYQHPPTLRLQGGPSNRFVPTHSDVKYGHQAGELNFWMPLTSYKLTQTTLWVETTPGLGDFHALEVTRGDVAAFWGSCCRHHVPANPSIHTRVSLDFRVGVEGCFDETWVLRGTRADHSRRQVNL